MKKPGKTVITVAAAVVAIITAGLIVSAYFGSFEGKDNTVIPAENVIEISEDFIPPAEQGQGDNIYKKQISIVNSSNAPCYVRVYMDFSDSQIRNRSYLSNDPNAAADSFYKADRSTSGDTYIANLSTLAPGWVFIPDDAAAPLAGYYYYTNPVAAGGTTSPLITFVKTVNTNAEEIQQYDIIVYSESIQTTNTSGDPYTDYNDAWTTALS